VKLAWVVVTHALICSFDFAPTAPTARRISAFPSLIDRWGLKKSSHSGIYSIRSIAYLVESVVVRVIRHRSGCTRKLDLRRMSICYRKNVLNFLGEVCIGSQFKPIATYETIEIRKFGIQFFGRSETILNLPNLVHRHSNTEKRSSARLIDQGWIAE
jgi:hypothetical protein